MPSSRPALHFRRMGFDSYAAHSLMSSTGEQMGIVVALDRAALADQALTEALLKIFAARAAAEIERSRAEQSYREILDAADDAIFVHDWDTGAIIDVSAKAADLFGHTREALKRLRVGDLSADVPPYTEADAMAHIERAKQSDSPLRFEWRAKHKDGTLMWHEVTLKRAQVGGHRRVLAFVRDVTERKAAADALQMRERQYRAIFDGSVDAMVLWNDQDSLRRCQSHVHRNVRLHARRGDRNRVRQSPAGRRGGEADGLHTGSSGWTRGLARDRVVAQGRHAHARRAALRANSAPRCATCARDCPRHYRAQTC